MKLTHAMPGRLRAALISTSASLLLIGSTLAMPVMAADQTAASSAAQPADVPHGHQIHGTVKTAASGSGTTFTVTTERFGDISVSFAGAAPHGRAAGRGHARSHQAATAADIKVGERIVAQGEYSSDGKSFVARRVHVLPADDQDSATKVSHGLATITSVSTQDNVTSLTLKFSDNSSQTVTLAADAKIRPHGKTVADLKAGTRVTVVSKGGVATGVVVMPD